VVLHHSHITAVFVNIVLHVYKDEFVSVKIQKDTMLAGCLWKFLPINRWNAASTGCCRGSEKLVVMTDVLAAYRRKCSIWNLLATCISPNFCPGVLFINQLQ